MNGPAGAFMLETFFVETSAIVAILVREPEAQEFLAILASGLTRTCACNLFEASLAVANRKGIAITGPYNYVAELIAEFAVELVSLTPDVIPPRRRRPRTLWPRAEGSQYGRLSVLCSGQAARA